MKKHFTILIILVLISSLADSRTMYAPRPADDQPTRENKSRSDKRRSATSQRSAEPEFSVSVARFFN